VQVYLPKKFNIVPEPWAKRIQKVEVGKYQEWAKVSDHVPLIVEIGLSNGRS
jgi:hypothetical protein